jgi:hypothetical protein
MPTFFFKKICAQKNLLTPQVRVRSGALTAKLVNMLKQNVDFLLLNYSEITFFSLKKIKT